MKEIRDGVIYDTEDATMIGTLGPEYICGFIVEKKTLYRGARGRFFLVIEHPGQKSFIARCLTGDWPSPAYIVPIGDNDALAFIAKLGLAPEDYGLRKLEKA